MISEKQDIAAGNKSDYTLGKGSRGANSSFSSQSFRGRLMQAHPERHDVLNYYEVLGQLRKNGSTSDVFIVRRRKRPRSLLSRWMSWITADGSNVSLRSAALHAPPLSSITATQEKDGCKSEDEQQKIYAIKSMRKDRVKNNFYLRELKNEVRLLKHLDHANIVRIYETFEKKKEIHLVLEYCSGGDLHQRAPYTEKASANIVKQILSAVKCKHMTVGLFLCGLLLSGCHLLSAFFFFIMPFDL
jgi:serine/threonine protein kinase